MYIVQSGDSLSKISKKFYGDPNKWKRIFEANRDVVKNPDVIQPGWTLRIPD
jgi:nucleoid-associated protein YgaU